MNCDCTSYSIVFLSYQDECLGANERLCAMEPRLRLEKFLPQAGLEPGTFTVDLRCEKR